MFLMLPLRTGSKLGVGDNERLLSAQVLGRIADIHGFGISRSLQDCIAMAAGFEQPKGHRTGVVAVRSSLENL
jgi:hypothetical protein